MLETLLQLPGWFIPGVIITFLVLMLVEIIVRIVGVVVGRKAQRVMQDDIDSIRAKVELIFLTLRIYPPEPEYDIDEDRYDTDKIERVVDE